MRIFFMVLALAFVERVRASGPTANRTSDVQCFVGRLTASVINTLVQHSMDRFADKRIGNLFEKPRKTSLFQHSDVDYTTLGKPSHISMRARTHLQDPLSIRAHPHLNLGRSALPPVNFYFHRDGPASGPVLVVSAKVSSPDAAAVAKLQQVPKLSMRRRNRDVFFAVWRRVRASVGLGKESQATAEELVGSIDGSKFKAATSRLRDLIMKTVRFARGSGTQEELEAARVDEITELGWQKAGQASAMARSLEVWGYFSSFILEVVKARRTKGTAEEVSAAKTAAAKFILEGLFRLGPTFVKLGQVISTRVDILEKEYIDVLRNLQDNVPGFGGDLAVAIIEKEIGRPISEIFDSFEKEPIAAASLGQVHCAIHKGEQVAVKVQRPGLRELFAVDLKNLKALLKLMDKFDPKFGGVDSSYVEIFEESSRLLYEEIDYTLEGKNAERFARKFDDMGIDYVRVPRIYWEATNPQVLTMEFIEAFKLTDLETINAAGLDKKKLSTQIADAFLAQILKMSYIHCDPHPGNLQCDEKGKLVYFDCGMMKELQPNVATGFKKASLAVFSGGPYISEFQLNAAGKQLVDAFETAGILARGADRLSVEKWGRFFIRAFLNVLIGKSAGTLTTLRANLGADLKALTDQQVWRLPPTVSFMLRAFSSVESIGKGLAPDFDIIKSAQPFVLRMMMEDGKGTLKTFSSRFAAATGLLAKDIHVAVTQPKKVEYLEQTIRAMERGDLKIRVRSLQNERALTRLSLGQAVTNRLLLSVLFLNLGLAGVMPFPATLYLVTAAFAGVQAGYCTLKIIVFDKQVSLYEVKDFDGER